jgi:hypothetical protein
MTALAIAGSNRLPILAGSINEHLLQAEAATRRGLEHAIAAGLLLTEAKDLVEHGEWLPWLQANCPHISPRQAQTYMRLARHRGRLDAVKNAATAHLTIAAAEALVGRPRPERQLGLPGQLDLLGGPEVTAPILPKVTAPTPQKVIAPTPPAERYSSPLDRDRVHHLVRDLQRVRTAAIRRAEEPSILILSDVITALKKHLAYLYSY